MLIVKTGILQGVKKSNSFIESFDSAEFIGADRMVLFSRQEQS